MDLGPRSHGKNGLKEDPFIYIIKFYKRKKEFRGIDKFMEQSCRVHPNFIFADFILGQSF
jgi:hypothetical protein